MVEDESYDRFTFEEKMEMLIDAEAAARRERKVAKLVLSLIHILITAELETRERNKRARLFRRARFPQVKSFEGYDFSQVVFPDGYGEADLRSLKSVSYTHLDVYKRQPCSSPRRG